MITALIWVVFVPGCCVNLLAAFHTVRHGSVWLFPDRAFARMPNTTLYVDTHTHTHTHALPFRYVHTHTHTHTQMGRGHRRHLQGCCRCLTFIFEAMTYTCTQDTR